MLNGTPTHNPLYNGVARTISGTTDANRRVALKNPSTGDYIAWTNSDGSGNYSFSVDSNIPTEIVVANVNDSQITASKSLEEGSALPTSWYKVVTTGYYSCLAVANFPESGGSAASYWVGTPSAKVVDAGPYLLADAINTYGFTGPGHGAKIAVEMCPIGGGYQWYSSRVELESLYGGIGRPLQHFNVLAIGRDYQSPHFQISGTTVHLYSGSVEQAREAGFSNAFEYEYNTYYTRPSTMYRQIVGRQMWIYDNDRVISEIESVWGSDRSQWAVYQSDYSGGKFSAAVPGGGALAEPDGDSSSSSGSDRKDAITDCFSVTNFWKQDKPRAYRAIIYGVVDPSQSIITDESDVGSSYLIREGSPAWAVNSSRKIITETEFNILKGYFGDKLITSTLLDCNEVTTYIAQNFPTINSILQTQPRYTRELVSETALWFYNVTQFVKNLVSGESNKTFVEQWMGEYIDILEQGKGSKITTTDGQVRKILDKISAANSTQSFTSYTIKNSNNNTNYTIDITGSTISRTQSD